MIGVMTRVAMRFAAMIIWPWAAVGVMPGLYQGEDWAFTAARFSARGLLPGLGGA